MKYVRIDWCVYVINVKLVHIRQHFNSDCVVIIFIKRDNCCFFLAKKQAKTEIISVETEMYSPVSCCSAAGLVPGLRKHTSKRCLVAMSPVIF